MSSRPPITEAIARFAVTAEVGDGLPELRKCALRAVIDTVGVAVAARNEAGVRILAETVGEESVEGTATVLTTGRRTVASQAALLNGLASHALDYDDVTHPIYGHASVALIPALLAIAEERRSSGIALLDAYVVGYQVICSLAAGLSIREHYAKGWHSTVTTGVIAATAGVCRLMRLDTAQTRNALGIAASMASGSRQNFGTMTKPLHPGLAARNAVLAARLAANGFTADPSQLESPLGYFAMYGDSGDIDRIIDRLDRPWALLDDGINVKKYPCCYNTHRTADATLSLAPKVPDIEDISRVIVTVEPGGADPLIRHRPVSGLEAKFSAEYVVAAGLIDGRISLESFTDAAVLRPQAQQLLRKVELTDSPTPPFGEHAWDYAYSTVEIRIGGGSLRERVDIPRGDARRPLTDAELDAKFCDCVQYAKVDWDGAALLGELRDIESARHLNGFAAMATNR